MAVKCLKNVKNICYKYLSSDKCQKSLKNIMNIGYQVSTASGNCQKMLSIKCQKRLKNVTNIGYQKFVAVKCQMRLKNAKKYWLSSVNCTWKMSANIRF